MKVVDFRIPLDFVETGSSQEDSPMNEFMDLLFFAFQKQQSEFPQDRFTLLHQIQNAIEGVDHMVNEAASV